MAEPPSAFYTRVFGLVSAGLLAFLLFRILQPFIGPILWSVLLAFLLFPVIRALRRVLGNRQTAAASVLTFGMVLVIIGPVTLLGVAFTRQAAELFSRMQSGQVTMIRPSDLLRVPIVDRLMQWAESVAPISAEQVEQWFVNAAKGLLAAVVAGSGAFVVEALGTVLNLVVMLFLLFFFLRDGEVMVRKARALIPMEPERQEHLVAHLAAVTRAVVLGSLVTALVQGTLVGLAFVLVGLPSPVVFGALAAVASLVPFVGSALVWVPAAGVLAYQGRWGAALFMALWGGIAVSSADNFIRPLFISGRARITTLPVFLGLAGGVNAFGPIGLVLGPVIVALVLALLRFAEESRATSLARTEG